MQSDSIQLMWCLLQQMQHKFFRQKRLSSSLRPAEGEEWREPLLDEKQRYPNSRCRKNEDEEENLFYMFLKKKMFFCSL